MVDSQLAELEKARDHARLLGVEERISLVSADAFKLPFVAERFDMVWNDGFIEHFDEPEKILAEMRRVARPGGAAVVLVPNLYTPHSLWIRGKLRAKPGGYFWDWMGRERSYSPRQLKKLLQSSGFQVIESSSSDLRRSLLDDNVILPHLDRPGTRIALLTLMNSIDWLEAHVHGLSRVGFMSGAVATVPGVATRLDPPQQMMQARQNGSGPPRKSST
jgi:SAM-dependent methyltransferase